MNALRLRHCGVAPVCLVDYKSEDIVVYSMDRKAIIHKEEIIKAAPSGKKFRLRTTWQMIKIGNGRLKLISLNETEVYLPLGSLAADEGRRGGGGLDQ